MFLASGTPDASKIWPRVDGMLSKAVAGPLADW